MDRVIHVAIDGAPTAVNLSKHYMEFTKLGEFLLQINHIKGLIDRCSDRASSEFQQMVQHCNQLISAMNAQFPAQKMQHVAIVTTRVRAEMTRTAIVPGVNDVPREIASAVVRFVTQEVKVADAGINANAENDMLSAAALGMTKIQYQNMMRENKELEEARQARARGAIPRIAAAAVDADLEAAIRMSLEQDNARHHVNLRHDLFQINHRELFGEMWSHVTYTDGTSTVNATFICKSREPFDLAQGGIDGEAPYCFLIGLWHDNIDYMMSLGITSPSALLENLKQHKLLHAPNKMFERKTILPVAEFLGATINVVHLDWNKQVEAVGDGRAVLSVRFTDVRFHYYSYDA